MIPKQIPYFISQEHNLIVKSIIKMSKNHPVNLLITGKRGLGKTELARQIAAVNGRDYFQVPVAVLQEAGQLLGSEEFRDNQTKYFASQFVSAIQTENMVIHLEELNRAESPKALGELFALLDDTRYLRHEKLGEIKVANGVIFIGTLNMGYEYTGIDPLDLWR
jgi:nitric oxide reductase NorQ protein